MVGVVVVVGFEDDVVAAADFLEGGAGFGGDPVRLHFLPRLRDEGQVGVEFVDHMAAVAVFLFCYNARSICRPYRLGWLACPTVTV